MSASLLALLIAQPAAQTGFVDKVFKNPDGHESPYVLFVPHGYDPNKPAPVILFLHGAGETLVPGRTGGKLPVEQGIGPHVKGRREQTFPALVVIPRAEGFGWDAAGDNGKRALAILDQVMAEYKCDPQRVYLTGLSMGGYGTWSLAAAHPDRWAAIVPVCGGLRFPLNKDGKRDPEAADGAVHEVAEKIKGIPCWCWHGTADGAVKVEQSRTLIDALRKAGGQPRYTELADVGHNSWDACYATDDVYSWLFKQKKSN